MKRILGILLAILMIALSWFGLSVVFLYWWIWSGNFNTHSTLLRRSGYANFTTGRVNHG